MVVADRDLLADHLTVLQTIEKDLPDVLKETTQAEVTERQVSQTTDLLLMVTGNHPRIILEEMVAMMGIKDLRLDLQETETLEIAMETETTEETEETEVKTEVAADTIGIEAITEVAADTTEVAADTTGIEAITEVAATTEVVDTTEETGMTTEVAETTEAEATSVVGLRMRVLRKVALKNRNLKGTLPNQNLGRVHSINN